MNPMTTADLRAESGPTLAECLASRQDNFLLIRLLAAAAVIFGHSYKVIAQGNNDFLANLAWGPGIYTGSLAVEVFFILSGFLVANSWVRTPNLFRFARARLLRLVPALAACMVLSALVLGPLVTTLPLREYLTHPDTWGYIQHNLMFTTNLRWSLPGVFADNPYPNLINGSLWTLPAEMHMYIGVAVIGLIGALRGPRRGTFVLLALYALNMVFPEWTKQLLHPDYVPLAGTFLLGVLFALNAHRIRLNATVLAGLMFATMLLQGTHKWSHLFALTLAYAVFWLGYIPRLPARWLPGDYSYGLYLWGYPMQQLVMHWWRPDQVWQVFCLSLLLAMTMAVASWHLVEQPALRFKRGWGRRAKSGASVAESSA